MLTSQGFSKVPVMTEMDSIMALVRVTSRHASEGVAANRELFQSYCLLLFHHESADCDTGFGALARRPHQGSL
jgi:hypothetical protein